MERNWSKFGYFSVALLWGASYAFQKPLVEEIGAINFTFWNFLISALIFLVAALWRRQNILYRLREGIILGVFLSGIEIFQTVGLKFSTAAGTAFLSNLGMLLIPYLGWIIFKHRVAREDNAALIIAIAGMYLFVGGLSGFGFGEFNLLLSALFMAFYFLYLERFDGENNAHILTLCVQQFFVISIASLLSGLLIGASFAVPSHDLFALAWMTFAFATLPYAVIQWASKYADEMIAALYDGVVEPLVGGVVAWAVFFEPTTAIKVFGGLLMVFAFGLSAVFSNRHFLTRG